MSIFGKVVKSTVGLLALGLDTVITKGAHGLEKRYGRNELVKTVSDIGSSSVRVTEKTVKTLTDVVDGGLEAGVGYLAKDPEQKSQGLDKAKNAGKEIVAGVGQGLTYTAAAGTRTTSSAFQAGRYYFKGEKHLAKREFGQTKLYAKHFGKTVAIGLLALGATDTGNPDYGTDNKGRQGEDGSNDAQLNEPGNHQD